MEMKHGNLLDGKVKQFHSLMLYATKGENILDTLDCESVAD